MEGYFSKLREAEKEINANNSGIGEPFVEDIPEMDLEIGKGKVYSTTLGTLVVVDIDEEDGTLVVMDSDDEVSTLSQVDFYRLFPEVLEVE